MSGRGSNRSGEAGKPAAPASGPRQQRLAGQLRANLVKRKALSRQRTGEGAHEPERSGIGDDPPTGGAGKPKPT